MEEAQFATTAKGASYVLVDSSERTVIVSIDAAGNICRSEGRYLRTREDAVITLMNSGDFPMDLAMHRRAFQMTFASEAVPVPADDVQTYEAELRQRIRGLRLVHYQHALFAALLFALTAFIIWYVLSL